MERNLNMSLNYQYYAIDPFNLSATYSGDGLVRPYQYKIKLTPKKNGSFEDTLDYEITEMNTEIYVKVSQAQLINALARGTTNDKVGEALFGHPDNLYNVKNIDKYDQFLLANKPYFIPLIRQYNVPSNKIPLLMLMDIHSHFAELLRNIYRDMLVQNFDASKN
jgi:hypothetical protein